MTSKLEDWAETWVKEGVEILPDKSCRYQMRHEHSAIQGALWLLKELEGWCKADPESSFHPNLSSWRLYDYARKLCGKEGGGDE